MYSVPLGQAWEPSLLCDGGTLRETAYVSQAPKINTYHLLLSPNGENHSYKMLAGPLLPHTCSQAVALTSVPRATLTAATPRTRGHGKLSSTKLPNSEEARQRPPAGSREAGPAWGPAGSMAKYPFGPFRVDALPLKRPVVLSSSPLTLPVHTGCVPRSLYLPKQDWSLERARGWRWWGKCVNGTMLQRGRN